MSPAHIGGSICALGVASATVLYDCHLALKTSLKRVPISIIKSKEACLVSFCAGLIALTAYQFTNGKGTSVIDTMLTLKQPQDISRGILVGLTVLVLIRSKLTTAKGRELVYSASRSWVVETVNDNWGNYKQSFNNKNLAQALTIPDYETSILDAIQQKIQVNEEDYRSFVEAQITNVTKGRPSEPFDPNSLVWKRYYRIMTNLALDYAGQGIFKTGLR